MKLTRFKQPGVRKEKPELKNLRSLFDNRDDLNKILSLYLDTSKDIRYEDRSNWGARQLFWVSGTGLDGEIQTLWINISCTMYRYGHGSRLSVANGRVAYILQSLGYKLPTVAKTVAHRYEKYAIHGISNLT